MKLILASNGKNHGSTFLAHLLEDIQSVIGEGNKTIYFVPFALADHAEYTAAAQEAFDHIGYTVLGAHEHALEEVQHTIDGIFVGGGNSFRLLKTLQEKNMIEHIQELVESEQVVYMGASAGSNIACPTIKTTNDMPIVEPASFDALGFIPFQINAHFIEGGMAADHMGETREQRIKEFHEENDTPVLGLREGSWLRIIDDSILLKGNEAVLLTKNDSPQTYDRGTMLTQLLTP
jgi:dipeptidase E